MSLYVQNKNVLSILRDIIIIVVVIINNNIMIIHCWKLRKFGDYNLLTRGKILVKMENVYHKF